MEHSELEKELQALRNKVRDLEAQLASADSAADEPASSASMQRDQRAVVQQLVDGLSAVEKEALHDWATRMVDLRHSRVPAWTRASQAVSVTLSSRAALPTLRVLAAEAKDRAWDKQGTGGRAVLIAVLAAALLTGPGAIAFTAAGMTVGFPLWIAFGSGVELATTIRDACAPAAPQEASEPPAAPASQAMAVSEEAPADKDEPTIIIPPAP